MKLNDAFKLIRVYDFEDKDKELGVNLNNGFYKSRVDISEAKELCYSHVKKDETGEYYIKTQFYNNIYDALESRAICYNYFGMERSITYARLIIDLPIIDFKVLLQNIHPHSINDNFIRIFKLNKNYPMELSYKLKLNMHDDIIDKYKDDLDWQAILANNIPLDNKNIEKYFDYFSGHKIFYENPKQIFNEENLKFITEKFIEKIKNDGNHFYIASVRDILNKIFVTHNLTEDQLFVILDTIRKNRDIQKDRRDILFDFIFTAILENQEVTENFIQRFKLKSLFKNNHNLICRCVNLSENFIFDNWENAKIINFSALSENKNVLYGKYSNDFYDCFIDDIFWDRFDYASLRSFSELDPKRFDEFLLRYKTKINKKHLKSFLESEYCYYSMDEIIENFKESVYAGNYARDYYWIKNKEYLLAGFKIENSGFDLAHYLNNEYKKLNYDIVKILKKEIFDLMLNKPESLYEEAKIKVNELLLVKEK